ncbi:hypothetical protein Mycch_0746 [Mycolicibacterium chubuense NBB4]|uniref:Secreted protein n=1 Tax=Mycolicibacterium chubuense (strain NBB4) TaxID=710421 RepID=I4BE56_MYCCN|nr:hypothetical protein [Mycolicibacterium chubuense]AFM15563.1 hypothetical protein Mycch_0746 [Mycolicibacterium chubuense NBB4]
MKNIARIVALPVLSAGIIGGALGLAGTAGAEVTTHNSNGSHSTATTPNMPHMPTHQQWTGPRHGGHRHGHWAHLR